MPMPTSPDLILLRYELEQMVEKLHAFSRDASESDMYITEVPFRVAAAAIVTALDDLEHPHTLDPPYPHRESFVSTISHVIQGDTDEIDPDDLQTTLAMLSGREAW